MAELSRVDRRNTYTEMARIARERANAAVDAQLQKTWQSMAEAWGNLADLASERCFCGRDAIGSKFYLGSQPVPYCHDHLAEAIASDTFVRSGIRALN